MLSGGRVLVAGGESPAGPFPTAAALFEPTNGTWADAGTLAEPRYFHTATLLPDGTVLVTGCADSGHQILASSELYHA
jgi:hypothetical protein